MAVLIWLPFEASPKRVLELYSLMRSQDRGASAAVAFRKVASNLDASLPLKKLTCVENPKL